MSINIQKQNLLVTLADKNYLGFAKQLFSSVYFNSGWQGDYMILAHDVPEEDLKWFREKGILIKHCSPLAEKTIGRWPVTILSKFYLFTPEFKKWDKIIYLDADLIVTASLDELLNVKKIGGSSNFAGCRYKLNKMHLYSDIDKRQYKKDKKLLNFNVYGFSAGLIVINTSAIDENYLGRLLFLWQDYTTIKTGLDEISLNLTFNGEWEHVGDSYGINIPMILKYTFLKPENIKGIILNFYLSDKPIDEIKYFYDLWKINFDKADLIDLQHRKPATKIWTKNEIRANWNYIMNSKYLFLIFTYLDRFVGLLGIFLFKIKKRFWIL